MLKEAFMATFFPNNTYTDFDLSAVSSMRTGGKARYAIFPETADDLLHAAAFADEHGCRAVTAGGTSNLLFPDDASELCVIFTKKLASSLVFDETSVTVSCGVMLPYLAREAQKRGLSGLEFACGIPGTVGGAVYMNAGAYGGETADVLTEVTAIDKTDGTFLTLRPEDCGFSYRKSLFMQNKNLYIVSATLHLSHGDPADIAAEYAEKLAARREKQPLEYPSCGSVFKRPEGHFAGKLIEDCGLKGFSVGGAAVSEKHAGFIINRGGATSQDVKDLIAKIRAEVYGRFGVLLEPEIEIL